MPVGECFWSRNITGPSAAAAAAAWHHGGRHVSSKAQRRQGDL